MENKKTKCVLVMASRFDGEIQFSPSLWNSEKDAVAMFVEIWIESHYLLKVITLSHEDRTDFEQEAQESDRELKKVFNDMFLQKDDHVCRYSKAMNQPYPRLCLYCKKPEQ